MSKLLLSKGAYSAGVTRTKMLPGLFLDLKGLCRKPHSPISILPLPMYIRMGLVSLNKEPGTNVCFRAHISVDAPVSVVVTGIANGLNGDLSVGKTLLSN